MGRCDGVLDDVVEVTVCDLSLVVAVLLSKLLLQVCDLAVELVRIHVLELVQALCEGLDLVLGRCELVLLLVVVGDGLVVLLDLFVDGRQLFGCDFKACFLQDGFDVLHAYDPPKMIY